MPSTLERESEFCSCTEEDEIEEDDINSPTDASEDSVDVIVKAITFKNKNKRKCSEPKKLDIKFPEKKQKLDLLITHNMEGSTRSPFRPWSASPFNDRERDSLSYGSKVNLTLKTDVGNGRINECLKSSNADNYLSKDSFFSTHILNSFDIIYNATQSVHQNLPTIINTFHKQEPLALVAKGKEVAEQKPNISTTYFLKTSNFKNKIHQLPSKITSTWNFSLENLPKMVPSKVNYYEEINEKESYVLKKIKFTSIGKKFKSDAKEKADIISPVDNKYKIGKLLSSGRRDKSSGPLLIKSSQGSQQKNYKNMTRERRIEANARERTRVHTISAAFDALRRSIPAYSHNQKLSKLSVLRIACSYIITLSRLAGYDYSKDQSKPDLSNCVEKVSKTIQTEGKIRKKREE